jgi:hypothetical protein
MKFIQALQEFQISASGGFAIFIVLCVAFVAFGAIVYIYQLLFKWNNIRRNDMSIPWSKEKIMSFNAELLEKNKQLKEDALKYQAIRECFYKEGDYQVVDFMRDVKEIITGVQTEKRGKPIRWILNRSGSF